MSNLPGVPSVIWQRDDSPTVESQTACSYCAFEGVDAPLERVFFWAGVSCCLKHLLALRTPPTE